MQPSATFIDFLKKAEDFASHPYLDPPGNTKGQYSTGYGHLIQPGERYLMGQKLTEADADQILRRDLAYAVSETNRAITRPVTQGQFDAMVDICFNAGPGGMHPVARIWNATGSIPATVAEIRRHNKAGGKVLPVLVSRREHNAAWFSGALGGIITGTAIERASVVEAGAEKNKIYLLAAVTTAVAFGVIHFLRNT